MAFNLAGLTDYVIQNAEELVTKSLFSAKTQMVVTKDGNLMTGIKSAETINRLATDAIFQAGGSCGFLSSGETSISQRVLTVGKVKVNESLCPKDLESKYTQQALPGGSRYDTIAFAKDFTDLKAGTISEQIEKGIWQGDTTSVDANLKRWDGYIKIIDAAGTAVNSNTAANIAGGPIGTGTGITVANSFDVVNSLTLSLPARVQGKSDVRYFCGWDVFSKFITKLVALNLFHYAPVGTEVSDENDGEIIIPGTQYKLTAVHGLDGTNRLFALRVSNMFLGTDLEHEEERWELFFAKEADEVRFVNEFKYGCQIAFPDEIATFKLV